jgi:hypothetical protein
MPKENGERILGKDPKTGKQVCSFREVCMAQIGEAMMKKCQFNA